MIILTRDRSGTCQFCSSLVTRVVDVSDERHQSGRPGKTKLSACQPCLKRVYEMSLRAESNDVERAEWP